MSAPATTLTFYPLRRYDTPPVLLGAGFLLGLLVFCVWLWQRPDDDRQAARPRGNGEITAQLGAGTGGVLDGITGESTRGGNFIAGAGEDSAFFQDEPAGEDEYDHDASVEEAYAAGGADADPDNMAIGDAVGVPPMEEGAALTDGLLGPPPSAPEPSAEYAAPPGVAATAPLQAWFVEVEIAPGQVQMLQLNAESPEHALAILRDFRGDPRVLRGPSPQPLP